MMSYLSLACFRKNRFSENNFKSSTLCPPLPLLSIDIQDHSLPALVTIARSSHDDYCPPDAVDGIQAKTLQSLERIFKDAKQLVVEKHYEEEGEEEEEG